MWPPFSKFLLSSNLFDCTAGAVIQAENVSQGKADNVWNKCLDEEIERQESRVKLQGFRKIIYTYFTVKGLQLE